MKTKLAVSVLGLAVFAAVAQVPFHSLPSAGTSVYEEKTRFVAVENHGGAGFYWLDSTNADLWILDPDTMAWMYLGSPRGSNTGPKGTYMMLSDRRGGVYVLNVNSGEGWRADRTSWVIIGEPSRLGRRDE